MAVVAGQTRRFAAASPVAQYWLANCAGFSAKGAARGTVERVLPDDDPFVPAWLEIRTSHKRVSRVPVSAVVEIVPAEGAIVLRRSRALRTHETRDRTLRLVARLVRNAWRVVAPASRWAGRETVRLVRSVPWQQYGRSVRSVTTRLWQEISTTWLLLRTTSSDPRNARRSSERARTTSST